MAPTDVQGPAPADPGSRKHPDLIPREFMKAIAVWSVIPMYLLAGGFIGWLVDVWLRSSPYGVGVGLVIGLALAVRDMLRLRDGF